MSTIPDASKAAAVQLPRRRLRLPLISALVLAFVSLSMISGAAYLFVLTGATGTADRLLIDRAERIIESEISLVRRQLDPVTDNLEMIAALVGSGRIDIESPVDVREALRVMMGRVPEVSFAAFATLDLKLHSVTRQASGTFTSSTGSLLNQARGFERFRALQTQTGSFWGALFWSEGLKQPVLNVRTPVRRIDNAFIGGLIATVSVGALSTLIVNATSGDENFFILVGRNDVLAHRRLVKPDGLGLSESHPLPTISEVSDPVLARIWAPPVYSRQLDRALDRRGHIVEVDGQRWVFVYRELMGYGPSPWTVGQYFPIEEATSDFARLTSGAIVGAGTLAVAAVLALIIGFSMARSIRTITSAAEAIERLEFDRPFHRNSLVREIDDAGHSLDKARGALKWFGAYVPHRLVFRLMELGEDAVRSRRREVTVMFTDIVEFTPQAENLPVNETAELLNHHFALLGACIEHEHGVIDKYIGDAVMAVWGGLSRMDDHADAAVRAALAIVAVVHEDNQMRRAAGHPPIRMRIGLHSGPVVVGNIGAPGRVNFTVVGDTVNIAQRFEQLGKEFMKDGEEAVVLVSGATMAAIKDKDALGVGSVAAVRRLVKGHDDPVEVFRLA